MNNKILSIHYMRGIAALLVVFFHFRSFLDNVYVQKDLGSILFGAGAFGVDLFFMISGFIIALSTERNSKAGIFVIRRFFRIYPAFIVIFTIGAATVYSSYSASELLRSFFFIHQNYSLAAPGFGFNILGPAWTLSYEIYFYFIFVISMSLSHKYRTLITSLLISSSVFLLQLSFNGTLSLSANTSLNISESNPLFSLARFCSSPILLEFIFGMFFYEFYKRVNWNISPGTATAALWISLGIFTSLYFSGNNYIFGLTGFGAWSLVLICGMLTYDRYKGFNENKPLNFLGDISYSIYLSHYVVIKALETYRPEWWVSIDGISRFIAATTICIFVAILLYKFVETPFLKVGKALEVFIKSKATPAIRV
ncbi:acyltransferase [Escherichia coli]|nr:acyltransferase [Escherichia coli]